jgi:AN1-type zinc finger protein 4
MSQSGPTCVEPYTSTTPSTACALCHKKLRIAQRTPCKCSNVYCYTHKPASAHACTYDYTTEYKRILEKSNPLVLPSKLERL